MRQEQTLNPPPLPPPPPLRVRQEQTLACKRREYCEMVPQSYEVEASERTEDELAALRQVCVWGVDGTVAGVCVGGEGSDSTTAGVCGGKLTALAGGVGEGRDELAEVAGRGRG